VIAQRSRLLDVVDRVAPVVASSRPLARARKARWARQRSAPPRCPRGWRVQPPDFVGVGTQKSGTTWWYRLLAHHPGVATKGHPKELDYFGAPDGAPRRQAEYECWFPRPPGALAGEWTPGYMADPAIAPRLAAVAPSARLLVMVRDPVERYVSALTMFDGHGDPEKEAHHAVRGNYAEGLERLFRSFAPEQVLVLQYERCVLDMESELARTYRFLGLDDGFMPPLARRAVNVTLKPRVQLSAGERDDLVHRYEPDVMRLSQLVPELDLDLWPNFAGA
jgi:hypothetical protein